MDQPYPEPQRRPAPVRARRPALHRARRRRLGGRPEPHGPGPLHAARQDPAHRSAPLRRDARIRSRSPTRSSDRSGARPEIYSYGLRNPWRFSFDSATGALAIGDVGQNEFEEVDLVARGKGLGANFGWSAYEGFDRFNGDQQAPDAVPPVFVYSHDAGLLDHRRLRGPRPQPSLALRPLPLRRLLRRSAAELHGHARPARHRRPRARAPGPVAELVRHDDAGHIYATSLRRTRLPARAAAELGLTARPIATLAPCAAGCITGARATVAVVALAALASLAAVLSAAGHPAAPRRPTIRGSATGAAGCGSTRSAASPRRPTSPTLPARLAFSTWSSRAARSGWSTTATSWAGPSSTSPAGSRPGASEACSRSPSIPTTGATTTSTPTTRTAAGTSRSTSSALRPTPGRRRARAAR